MTPHLDLAAALALIAPRPEHEAACAAMITEHIELLRRVQRDLKAIPSPGELRKKLRDSGRDLERLRRTLRRGSQLVQLTDSSRNMLDRAIVSARFHHDAIVVRPGSRPWDNIKALTAKFAFELLKKFSAGEPTKTAAKDGGAFLGLAFLLYRGVTGKEADLTRYCYDVLDHAGDGHIEPSIVARVPFGH